MNLQFSTLKTSIIGCAWLVAACTSNYADDNKSSDAELISQEIRKRNHSESQALKPTPPKACTLIGCINTLKVNFPIHMQDLDGELYMQVNLDGSETKNYKVMVNNFSSDSCKEDSIEVLEEGSHSEIFLQMSTKMCQVGHAHAAKRINKFIGFSLLNIVPRKSLELSITNSDGQHELQEIIDLTQIKPKIFEPNGPGCGSCQSIEVDLR